jgi:hypothetical protein
MVGENQKRAFQENVSVRTTWVGLVLSAFVNIVDAKIQLPA